MKKNFLLIFLFFISISFANALTTEQTNKILTSYNIGKTIKASDGMTFELTLPSIMGQESSWGKYVIGDQISSTGKLKSLYDSSLGNFQIKLSTAKRVIKSNPHLLEKYRYMIYDGKSIYKKFEYHKKEKDKYKKLLSEEGILKYKKNLILKNKDKENAKKIKYYKSVLNSKIWLERLNKGEKKAIATIKWAKKELKYHENKEKELLKQIDKNLLVQIEDAEKEFEYHRNEYNKLVKKARKDIFLINSLLNDFEFSAIIAGHYLKMCYEEALSKRFSNPYKRAVGRYNGGWNNINYFNKVKKRMKVVKKVIKS